MRREGGRCVLSKFEFFLLASGLASVVVALVKTRPGISDLGRDCRDF